TVPPHRSPIALYDGLEPLVGFFLLIQQGARIQDLQLDALERRLDLDVGGVIANFFTHDLLSLFAYQIIVEQHGRMRMRRVFHDARRSSDADGRLDGEPVYRRTGLLGLFDTVLIYRQGQRHLTRTDEIGQQGVAAAHRELVLGNQIPEELFALLFAHVVDD